MPRRIPRYELDPSVRVEKDKTALQTGIYLPDVEFAAARLLFPVDAKRGVKAYQGTRRTDYVCDTTGKPAYDWKESQWAETGWTLIRRVEGEFLDVPERGFFPRGEPNELYTWPEREAQFINLDRPHITALSGELAIHSGKWSIFTRKALSTWTCKKASACPIRGAYRIRKKIVR